MVDLAGIDEILALAAGQIDAVPFFAIKGKAGDGQRLTLLAGFLDLDVAATRDVGAVAHLGDDAFQPELAGMLVHLLAIDLEAVTELYSCAGDELLELGLAREQRQLPQVMTIQIKQVEGDKNDPG